DLVAITNRVGPMEQFEAAGTDHAVFDQRLEIYDLVPIISAKQHNRNAFAHLFRLHQRQDFEQFVERSKTAGEKHDRLGKIDEPELPHEEVVKAKAQLPADVGVIELLIRDGDREPDVDPSCF